MWEGWGFYTGVPECLFVFMRDCGYNNLRFSQVAKSVSLRLYNELGVVQKKNAQLEWENEALREKTQELEVAKQVLQAEVERTREVRNFPPHPTLTQKCVSTVVRCRIWRRKMHTHILLYGCRKRMCFSESCTSREKSHQNQTFTQGKVFRSPLNTSE